MSQLNASPATGAELYLFPNCVSAAGALQLRKGLQDLLFDLSAVGQSCASWAQHVSPARHTPCSPRWVCRSSAGSWERLRAWTGSLLPAELRALGTEGALVLKPHRELSQRSFGSFCSGLHPGCCVPADTPHLTAMHAGLGPSRHPKEGRSRRATQTSCVYLGLVLLHRG